MVAAVALGVLTLFRAVTPWMLLVFTFLMGIGAVMNDPAWQAITPDVISAPRHASAVALNSAGFNVARAVGPALGGIVVAAAGAGWSFLLERCFFFRRDFISLSMEASAPRRTSQAHGAGSHRGRISLCARRSAGTIGADSHRSLQLWRDFAACAVSGDLPAAWRARIRISADVFRTRRSRRSGGAAAACACGTRWTASWLALLSFLR